MNQRGPAAEEALKALQARKWATPSAVMVLEALSKTLPDEAHLTELRIESGKVQIGGSATDAPALIRLIEQSRRFTQATFFAPTVRGPSGGESFHIEAHIEPSFGRDELMRTSTHRLVIDRRQALAVVAYVGVVIALLAISLLARRGPPRQSSGDRSGSDAA